LSQLELKHLEKMSEGEEKKFRCSVHIFFASKASEIVSIQTYKTTLYRHLGLLHSGHIVMWY